MSPYLLVSNSQIGKGWRGGWKAEPASDWLCRYAKVLEEMQNDEHLAKFEDLLEAAVDLEKIPDEYLIAPTYDPGLEASFLHLPALTLVCKEANVHVFALKALAGESSLKRTEYKELSSQFDIFNLTL